MTPLVDFASGQEEYLKAARALVIPSALCVHSWDNLTNKGLIHVQPDRVFVWNGAQVREAETMHGIDPEHVVPTGAPCYDQWFTRGPSTTREEFCRKGGIGSAQALTCLFLLLAIHSATRGRLRQAMGSGTSLSRRSQSARQQHSHTPVLPRNDMSRWKRFDLAEFPNVVLWPREGTNPADAGSKNDYFDSLYDSAATVGINTSAQIEAGIVGRQVFSIRAPEYLATQEGTLHFHYLLTEHGGLLHLAETLEEHARAIARAFDRSEEDERRLRKFVEGFVRPRGLDLPATPLLADAIEQLGLLRVEAPANPMWLRIVRRALRRVATRMKVQRQAAEPHRSKPVTSHDRFEKKSEWVRQ